MEGGLEYLLRAIGGVLELVALAIESHRKGDS